jgi:hypothetical protein
MFRPLIIRLTGPHLFLLSPLIMVRETTVARFPGMAVAVPQWPIRNLEVPIWWEAVAVSAKP